MKPAAAGTCSLYENTWVDSGQFGDSATDLVTIVPRRHARVKDFI